jgi:general secretion pathway protein G
MRRGRGFRRAAPRGFTLIELIVVVAIIGILVTVAMPIYKDSVRKARESVLREDLYLMRDAIDQYFTDKGHWPSDLNALVDDGYLKQIPVDPITGGPDTWVTEEAEMSEAMPDQPGGIRDVKSGAVGTAVDGTPYNEL